MTSKLSNDNSQVPRVFRLKRKIDDDPAQSLALYIKRAKKPDGYMECKENDKESTICNVLRLASNFSNNFHDYCDLNVISPGTSNSNPKTSVILHQKSDETLFPFSETDLPQCKDDLLDNLTSQETVVYNGRPMIRIKKRKLQYPEENTVLQDFVYDFYIPEDYDAFKDGLPDKLNCNKLDLNQHSIDGITSLNVCDPMFSFYGISQNFPDSDSFDPVERQLFDCDDENLFDYLINGKQYRATLDDDEDSNEENDFRNDYPDEDGGALSDDDDFYQYGVRECVDVNNEFEALNFFDKIQQDHSESE